MGRPPRAIKRIAKVIRLEPDQWAAIDKAAGKMPRHDWIVKALLEAAEPKPKAVSKAPAPPAPASSPRVSIGLPPGAKLTKPR